MCPILNLSIKIFSHKPTYLDVWESDAFAGVFLQHQAYEVLEVIRGKGNRWKGEGVGPDLVIQHHNVVIMEWKLPVNKCIQGHTHGPDVCCLLRGVQV